MLNVSWEMSVENTLLGALPSRQIAVMVFAAFFAASKYGQVQFSASFMSLFDKPVDCNECGAQFVIDDSRIGSIKEGDLEVQYISCPSC